VPAPFSLVTGIIVVAVAGAIAWRSPDHPATAALRERAAAIDPVDVGASPTSIAFVAQLGQWKPASGCGHHQSRLAP
jgi:hypothetical protein